jgi:Abnormal spindle-like microcephaly-assoc'd, ASPM-SPD-2-Hydin
MLVTRSRFVFRPLGSVIFSVFGNQALELPSQKRICFRTIPVLPGRWFSVLLLTVYCLASGAYAKAQLSGIGFAQKNSATPQSTSAKVSVSYSTAQTLGDLNVVVVGWNDTTSTVQSVKDSAGNVYSLAIGATSGTALRQSIYYAANIAGASSNKVTVTFSQAAAYPDVRILEYRGVTTLDVTAGASGNSTSANSGASTTRSPNELIFGASTVATATKAAGSGFTSRVITTPDGDIAEDKIVTTAGSDSANATLTSSGPWVMQMVTFGTGAVAATPQLSASAGSLSFGSVTVNSSASKSLTLTSTGTSPVTVSSAAITGAGFTIVSGSLPVTLNPTQAVTLQVQFLPTATGSASGQITISSNSSTGGTTAVNLSGTGTAAANPQLTVSATSLSFGSVTVNTTKTQSLTLTSAGTSPVTVNSAAITGAGFTIAAASLPVTLNPTQSVTLQVQFDPTATGTASGQIAISSNSSKGSTASVALSGTGAAANPQLTVSVGSLSFGSVNVNTATAQSLTLTSTGSTPVTVNSATITGAGFTIIGGSFPITLNPNQTATLKLQFEPTTAGALTGQLSISSNSTTGSTATVSLTGTGTVVAHQVTLTWNVPPSSPDPVAGYNIYRATGTGSFTRINSSPDTAVTYVDTAVTSGTTYSYQVTSADPSGQESVPTSPVTVTIP